jgi:prephenate dehydrogenase
MKIMIIGLGLIGGSYAEGLKEKGHTIYGYDTDEKVLKEAIELNIIEPNTSIENIKIANLVVLCLYPNDNIEFIKKYGHMFHKKQVITDVSGTKVYMLNKIKNILPKAITYISHHPMAGGEKKGFNNRNKEKFKNANFIIIGNKKSRKMEPLFEIAYDLGFANTLVTTAKKHDELIAFTSQLTHVIAVSLVNSDSMAETKDATGDSYRDLTRIAKINEVMWTELFIENKHALLKKIKEFKKSLRELETLIKNENREEIKKMLVKAREKRQTFDKN